MTKIRMRRMNKIILSHFFVRAGRTYTPPNGLQLTLSSAIAPYMGTRGREGGEGERGRGNKTQGVLTRSDTLVMKNLGQ